MKLKISLKDDEIMNQDSRSPPCSDAQRMQIITRLHFLLVCATQPLQLHWNLLLPNEFCTLLYELVYYKFVLLELPIHSSLIILTEYSFNYGATTNLILDPFQFDKNSSQYQYEPKIVYDCELMILLSNSMYSFDQLTELLIHFGLFN